MMAKIMTGKNFLSAARYVCNKKGARYLCGTLAGKSPEEFASEIHVFERVMGAIPGVEDRVVHHEAISLHPREKLSDPEWRKIVTSHMEALGLGQSPWVAVRHTDRPHQHVHIVALRLDPGYRAVPRDHNYERAALHLGGIAEKYGLQKVMTRRMKHEEEIRMASPSG